MKQPCTQSQKRSWFQKLIDGYAWACRNIRLLVTFLVLYTLLMILIGWHTNQALCYFAGTRHLYGVPFLIIGLLGMLTLIHEADHVWKYKWSKLPIGILSIFFIYYCIRMLHNQSMELPTVNVIGISDPTHNKRIPIGTLLADRKHTKPTIVVDHDPRYMDAAVERKADLILSGHTHAGQFFPASILTRIALGKPRFYGHHIIGKTHTVVTSGAGFFNLPARIGTSNEIAELIIAL